MLQPIFCTIHSFWQTTGMKSMGNALKLMDWSAKLCINLTIVLRGQRLLQPEQDLHYRADDKNYKSFNSPSICEFRKRNLCCT